MLIPILLSILMGITQSFCNIICGYAMKKKCNPVDFSFWNTFVCTIFLAVYVAIKNLFFTKGVNTAAETDFHLIIPIMLIGSAICCISNPCNLQAMKLGNVGISNSIFSSCFGLNFVFMVIFFTVDITILSFIAIAFMILGIFLMSAESIKSGETSSNSKKWIFFVFMAFFMGGLGQFVTTIPAQFQYRDGMDIRGLSVISGMLLFYGIIKAKKKIKTNPHTIKYACFAGCLTGIIQLASYPITDLLVTFNAIHIYSPVVQMVVIITVAMYSRLFLKEPLSSYQYMGLASCLAGILLFVF